MAHDIPEAEYYTYKALYKNLGARIKFQCDHVTYEGIVDAVKPTCQQVIVRHAKVVEKNKYFGNLRFHLSEIPFFTIVESAEVLNRHPKNEYLLNILKSNKPNLYGATISEVLFGDKENESDDDSTNDEEEEFILDAPPHLRHKLPNDAAVIDSVGEDFDLAVQHISRQNVIGVSFDGPLVSRFGKLTWICISTTACVFLFDIEKLKNQAFDDGLRHIFEKESIKKIIHDSRFPCDCLTWQYSTRLNNVFDTRVADFLVNKQRYNDKFNFDSFSSLDCCLRNYLGVPQEFLFKRDTCSTSVDKGTCKRPITNALTYDLMKNALYLILLQEKLRKELQAPFHKTVAACKRILAKASKEEISTLGNELSAPDAIPPGLFMQGIQTAGFKKPMKKFVISLECKFIDPKTQDIVKPKGDLHLPTVTKRNLHSTTTSKIVSIFGKKSHTTNSETGKNNEDHLLKNVESHFDNEKNTHKEIKMFSMKPSYRYMDEVFHKLANKVCSDHSDSVVMVKPPDDYISKFCVKKPFFDCTTLNSSSENNISHFEELLDNSGESISNSRTDYSETWAKIRAEIAAEDDMSISSFNKRKIIFVPA